MITVLLILGGVLTVLASAYAGMILLLRWACERVQHIINGD
jgi:hypothetical protein